jgi:hypothetical protein
MRKRMLFGMKMLKNRPKKSTKSNEMDYKPRTVLAMNIRRSLPFNIFAVSCKSATNAGVRTSD